MRTSASQFEMLVTFMEQHGDLSKLSTSNARGRITSIQHWEELTALLNSDGAGATKTTERWKKAWSDFKNNTKKKAARLHKAASGTGGGPAVFAKLADLEHRVLNLMGVQVATGLALEEAGLPQEIQIQPDQAQSNMEDEHRQNQFEEYSQQNVENQCEIIVAASQSPSPSLVRRAISSPPLIFVEQEVQSSQHTWNEPGPSRTSIAQPPRPAMASTQLPLVDIQVEGMLSPTRPSSLQVVQPEPAPSVQTTPRRGRPRTRGTPRRRGVERARPAHMEQATQHFLQADSFWRTFKEQQHQDQIRIREMEIQVQRDWQAFGQQALNLLERLVDKF